MTTATPAKAAHFYDDARAAVSAGLASAIAPPTETCGRADAMGGSIRGPPEQRSGAVTDDGNFRGDDPLDWTQVHSL